MRKIITKAMVAAALLVPTSAMAEQIPFNSTVNSTCTIRVVQNGLLVPQLGAQRLSTNTAAGGQQGLADVTTTSRGFTITPTPPTSFAVQPAADTAPTTFLHIMFGLGATTFSSFGPSPRPLNAGTTNLRLTLIANKPAGQSFADGNYTAYTRLTCE